MGKAKRRPNGHSYTGKAPPADPEGRSFVEVGHAAARVAKQRKRADAAAEADRVPTFEDFEKEQGER